MQPTISSLQRGIVSPGSACSIAGVPEEWVDSIPLPNPVTGKIIFDIVIKAGFTWLNIPLVSRTRPFKEESTRDAAGTSWSQVISGRISGQTTDLQHSLQQWQGHRWVILYKEVGTGCVYLVGKPGAGALLDLQYSNDKATITAVSFACKAVQRAPIYQGIF